MWLTKKGDNWVNFQRKCDFAEHVMKYAREVGAVGAKAPEVQQPRGLQNLVTPQTDKKMRRTARVDAESSNRVDAESSKTPAKDQVVSSAKSSKTPAKDQVVSSVKSSKTPAKDQVVSPFAYSV